MSEFRSKDWRNAKYVLVIFAAAVAFAAPIYLFGIPQGNDLVQHYQFAVTFDQALRVGDWYTGWAAATNAGFGDAGVRFYPPLSYYVLIFFKALAGSWYLASVVAIVFWTFLGGCGIFLLAREWMSDAASLGAGLLYIFLPYHANEIYNASLVAEFCAAGLLPFCFLFAQRVCRRGELRDVLGLATAYALLILTHLPTAVIGSISLFIFSAFSLRNDRRSATLAKLGTAAALGLAGTSFYLVQMLSELDFVNHTTAAYVQTTYDFHSNFFGSYFTASADDYAGRSLWFGDLVLVLTAAAVVAFSIIFVRSNGVEGVRRYFALLVLFAVSVFLVTPLSEPVWEHVTLLQKIQFPFRWMTIVSLTGVILIGAGLGEAAEMFRSKYRPVGLIAFGLIAITCIFTMAQVIRPALYINEGDFEPMVAGLNDDISYECWWPVWTKAKAIENKTPVQAGDREVRIDEWRPFYKTFQIASGEPVDSRVALFYYPFWRARVNGTDQPVDKDEFGAVILRIPPGPTSVELTFIEPGFYNYARWFSVAVWAMILVSLASAAVRIKTPRFLWNT